MIVYIEYVLLNNFLVTLMLLVSTNILLKQKSNKLRVILACLLGAGMAIVYPICNLSGIVLLLLKTMVGFLISATAFKNCGLKKLFVNFVIFMFLTALYGGINLMIYFAVYGDFSQSKTLPLPIILFSIFTITYFVKQISMHIYNKKKIAEFIYEIELVNNNKKVKTNAYLDSGNVLCDPETNTPIVVINFKIFNKLFNDFSPMKLMKKQIDNLKNGHYIKVSTVTTNGEMLVFSIDNLILKMPNGDKTIVSPMLGLTQTSFKHLCCDMLLNPKLIS